MVKLSQKNREKIKRTYKEWFGRELTNSEIDAFEESFINSIKYFYEGFDGFNKKELAQMLDKDVYFFFSPQRIFSEYKKIPQEVLKKGKYKKAKELAIAAAFSLNLRKMGLGEYYIMATEAPDIYLTKKTDRGFKKKPFDLVKLEIMTIPAHEKDKFDRVRIERDIIRFIKSKKFTTRYGKFIHLLVYLAFTHKKIKLTFLHEEIKKIKTNPFFQIWLFFFSSPDLLDFDIVEIYPSINQTTLSFAKDKHLIF